MTYVGKFTPLDDETLLLRSVDVIPPSIGIHHGIVLVAA